VRLALLLLLACARAHPAVVPVEAPKPKPPDVLLPSEIGRIVRVHFRGAHHVPEQALRDAIAIDKVGSVSGAKNREVIERDVLYVQAILYDYGHIQSRVQEPLVEIAADGAIEVTYIFEEGPRFRLGALTVSDADGAPLATLEHAKQGDWFSRKILVDDLAGIRHVYRDAGYANVEADPEAQIEPSTNVVTIAIPIKRGPIMSFEKVKIEPENELIAGIVKRNGVVSGARFSETKLETIKREAAREHMQVEVSTAQNKSKADRIDVTFEPH